ncbi:DUF4232 domain-containing protein [Yinghuangia seranimata]|uniref:DUF4232 domain-containing protein n=1 Tax=Yinghuangia seranimata TaxID=408067 RepID=UPI00248B72B3|nr:DUF4232 domain-containing protein [Yinghuangia seranimata]MDI2130748.1 DUF4232 domain-containing protein [Yinghuangia seranimata]
MSANRRQTVLASAALVVGALLMTACQGSDSGAAQGASSNTPGGQAPAAPNTANPGGSSGGTGQGSQGGTQGGGSPGSGSQGGGKASGGQSGNGGAQGTSAGAGTTSGGGGKTAKCRTDQLKTTAIDNTIGGDPDGTVAVTFTNNGPDCTMAGYAGVNLKTDAGEIPAQRTGQEPVSITLKSGKGVSFGVNYPVENMGEASGVRITGLVVTPPDETKSVTVAWPGAAKLPVKSGGAPIKVGPIGSAGQGG